jgi:hypothetical protein
LGVSASSQVLMQTLEQTMPAGIRSTAARIIIAWSFGVALCLLAFVPRLNAVIYTGHGGLGYLFIWLAFPWMATWSVIAGLGYDTTPKVARVGLILASVMIYSIMMHWIGGLAQVAVTELLGLPFRPNEFRDALTFPLSMLWWNL